ncbi:MAG: LamG-like jellyroll fold domain-containing protein [Candidatus Sumerlaeota bacterium]
MKKKIACLIAMMLLTALALGADFKWQEPQATVTETGTLLWKPEPFQDNLDGQDVRYIDFENGDDANDGLTPQTAWKRHPWDPDAAGRSAAASGVKTYVFKRGVFYRGSLKDGHSGTADTPVRITSTPNWGDGDAMIVGSEQVTGWQKGAARDDIPDAGNVWYADIDFAPRTLFLADGNGGWKRLPLARTPNWKENRDETYDVRKEWWELENPGWWENNNSKWKRQVNGTKMHLGVDTKNLTKDADFYEGAYVWSEWGILMGAPYAAPVEKFFPQENAIAFQGPWNRDSQVIMEGNRYYLENKPQYLDEPGEWWFEKEGDQLNYQPGQGGRLYVRLPGDADPTRAQIEAGKRISLVDLREVSHIEISGLHFMMTNVFWNLHFQTWQHPEVHGAAVRILGSGTDIAVRNNRFDHVVSGIRIDSESKGDPLDQVFITDNEINHTDHGAIHVKGNNKGTAGRLLHVETLRNKLYDIGQRSMRVNGHFAIVHDFPETAVIAGNIVEWTYAAGIDTRGGKGSGVTGYEAPLSRILVFNNQVVDSMLGANDWGGIETWQGGPFYVYNNVSGNAVGPFHWRKRTFAHAYYMDGSFKNYMFNNIAWGRDFAEDWLANVSAFQEIHSYQNAVFNNTAYNVEKGSRRQKPEPGRDKFLGNIWQNIHDNVFRHSDKEGVDPNVADAGQQGDVFDYETNAYANNVFYDIGNTLGTFEAEGGDYKNLEDLAAAMEKRNAMASSVGVMAENPPLVNAAEHDFRPAPGSAAIDFGVRAFVPWSLYGTVGEWNFTRNNADSASVINEAWYLTSYHKSREDYETRPLLPLTGHNISADSYVQGALEDWAPGALMLNGKDQYLSISQEKIAEPFYYEGKQTQRSGAWAEVTLPQTLKAGKPAEISVTLKQTPPNMMVQAHLHWMKDGAFGGFNAWGGQPKPIKGAGPYKWNFTPEMKDGLSEYSLALFISSDGEFDNHVKIDRINIEPGDANATQTVALGGDESSAKTRIEVSGKDLKNVQVDDTSFMLEAYFKAGNGSKGVIVQKMDGGVGYSLSLNASGQPVFRVAGGGQSAEVTADTPLADGQWHHLLAECSREDRKMTLYIDGKEAARADGPGAQVSLANQGDFFVGGTPDGQNLAIALDFLRMTLGTLAHSKTTIDELHAWQHTDGPFLFDMRGQKPKGERRDAGALER